MTVFCLNFVFLRNGESFIFNNTSLRRLHHLLCLIELLEVLYWFFSVIYQDKE